MKALEEKILREGTVLPGNILKVGSFLNHQIDVDFLMEMGREIARLFGFHHRNQRHPRCDGGGCGHARPDGLR